MRAVLQRVKSGKVTISGQVVSEIGPGIVVLLGVSVSDHWADAEYCIRRILRSKMWNEIENPERSWASSVMDNDYEVLVVSQFTLLGTLKKGNKPDFHAALESSKASEQLDKIVAEMRKEYKPEKIKTGRFGADMNVEIQNDGPVTLLIDTTEMQLKREPAPRKPQGSAASSPGQKKSPKETPQEIPENET